MRALLKFSYNNNNRFCFFLNYMNIYGETRTTCILYLNSYYGFTFKFFEVQTINENL